MLKEYIVPSIKIEMFDSEKVVASDYIAAVQQYINAAAQSEALHKRMEMFLDLLQYK